MRYGLITILFASVCLVACSKPKMPPPPLSIYRAENCISSDQVSRTWLRISQTHQQACKEALSACHYYHQKHHTKKSPKCIILS